MITKMGTTDISIIELSDVDGETQIEVLSTNGDTSLGGEDIDNRIIEYLVAEFKKDNGVDLKKDVLALQRLKEGAEKAKIELSSTTQTEINLPYITADSSGPKHLQVKLTRAKFESMIQDIVQRTIDPCSVALEDAKLKTQDIDEVILVGGSTRIPAIQTAVEKFFGKAPRKDVNPDEAVAAGAAIQGAVLAGDRSDVLLLDVTPLSLGIETLGGAMTKLIEKNTTIPTRASQVFSTAEDNQPAVTIKVYQGERELAQYNKALGEFNLEGIPPARRGTPQIEVTFDVDANGIMNISARDKGTGKENKITIKSDSGLSASEVERMIKEAEENAESDRKARSLIEARNMAESTASNLEKDLADHKDLVDESIETTVKSTISEIQEAIKLEDSNEIIEKVQTLSGKAYEALRPAIEKKAGVSAVDPESVQEEVVDAEFKEK